MRAMWWILRKLGFWYYIYNLPDEGNFKVYYWWNPFTKSKVDLAIREMK